MTDIPAEEMPSSVSEAAWAIALQYSPCFVEAEPITGSRYCHHESEQSCGDVCKWAESIARAADLAARSAIAFPHLWTRR